MHGGVVGCYCARGGFLQGCDDTRAWQDVGIGDLRPADDALRAAGILLLNGACGNTQVPVRRCLYVCERGVLKPVKGREVSPTPNVGKLAVLKDQEALLPCYILQSFHCSVAEVGHDVSVRLEYAYRVPHFLGEREEFRCGCYIRGEAEVRLLDGDEAEEVGSKRRDGREGGAFSVGAPPGRMAGGRHSGSSGGGWGLNKRGREQWRRENGLGGAKDSSTVVQARKREW